MLDAATQGTGNNGVASTYSSPGYSKFPIRYFDGTVMVAASDLESAAGGIPWGVTRQWTNGPGYARQNQVGAGMVLTERPALVQIDVPLAITLAA